MPALNRQQQFYQQFFGGRKPARCRFASLNARSESFFIRPPHRLSR